MVLPARYEPVVMLWSGAGCGAAPCIAPPACGCHTAFLGPPKGVFAPLPAAQIMGQIMSGHRPPLPDPSAFGQLPGPGPFPGLPAWIELMQRCWAQDSAQRPDFAAVISQLR